MLILSLLVLGVAVVGLAAYRVRALGGGDWRRGRLAALRRVRRIRRRMLRPRLSTLRSMIAVAWARPQRKPLSDQVRRLADRLERARWDGDRFAEAQRRLESVVARLEKMGPASWTVNSAPGPSRRRQVAGRGWVISLLLALAGVGLAAANGWVLHSYVVPDLLAGGWMEPSGLTGLVGAAGFAALSFLLGLSYFALTTTGSALGLRVLAVIAAAVVASQAALEGAAVVAVLQFQGLADLTWWGGIAGAILLGGAAALIPPTVAALAHASIEYLDQWVRARERRADRRDMVERDRIAGRVQESLEGLSNSVEGIRSELVAIGWEPGGKLLLQPTAEASVERLTGVLRRMAVSMRADVEVSLDEPPHRPSLAGRLLADLAVLMTWVAATAAVIVLASGGLLAGTGPGTGGLVTAGGLAALGALAVSGLVFRLVAGSLSRPLAPGTRAAAVLLIGLGSVSFALAVGPLAAGAGAFDGEVLTAAAWLNLLVLTAALASVRLHEGVSAAASVVALLTTGAAFLLVKLVDLSLAAADRALVGFRRPHSVRRQPSYPGATARPAVGSVGKQARTR